MCIYGSWYAMTEHFPSFVVPPWVATDRAQMYLSLHHCSFDFIPGTMYENPYRVGPYYGCGSPTSPCRQNANILSLHRARLATRNFCSKIRAIAAPSPATVFLSTATEMSSRKISLHSWHHDIWLSQSSSLVDDAVPGSCRNLWMLAAQLLTAPALLWRRVRTDCGRVMETTGCRDAIQLVLWAPVAAEWLVARWHPDTAHGVARGAAGEQGRCPVPAPARHRERANVLTRMCQCTRGRGPRRHLRAKQLLRRGD